MADLSSKQWIEQVFDTAQTDKDGGVIRRSVKSVEQFASHDELLEEYKKRGFHLLGAGEQYLIIYNHDCICIYC